MASRVSVALFGAYRGASQRLARLAQAKELSVPWVIDSDPQNTSKLVESFPERPEIVKPAYSHLPLEDPKVDAVIMCTPQVNVNMVRKALNHGKGVFTSAPFYREVGALLACEEEATHAGKPFFCHLNRRFDNTLRHLREKVLSGKIGSIQTVKLVAAYGPYAVTETQPQEQTESLFHDCAVNELDLACWLLDQDPESVFAQVGANTWQSAELTDNDSAVIVLQFRKGIMATIDLKRSPMGGDSRVEIYGAGGLITVDNSDAGTTVTYMTSQGSRTLTETDNLDEQEDNSFTAGLRHFLAVLKGEEKKAITLSDKMRASLLASACLESQKKNSVVTLSLDFLRDPEKLVRPVWKERPDIY